VVSIHPRTGPLLALLGVVVAAVLCSLASRKTRRHLIPTESIHANIEGMTPMQNDGLPSVCFVLFAIALMLGMRSRSRKQKRK
jgi:hypothetical protein